jgi:DNA-binding NarL/FixJ family response regulator
MTQERSAAMIVASMESSVVTVLVADRSGADLRELVAAHGGRALASAGEGVTAVFPSAAEAVRCAVKMQAASEGVLRLGLDAGEPERDGDAVYGRPVTIAGRLCDGATAGSIVVSDVVAQIAGPRVDEAIAPIGGLRLPGVDGRVAAAEVVWDQGTASTAEDDDPTRRITVVIADDQRLVRAGFRVILDAEPDIVVVGEASDGRAVVDVVNRRRPDVVLMDIRMPELDGLKATERILAEMDPAPAVIMLTTFDRSEYVYEALRIGASGFLLKDAPADRLLDAVRVVAAGDALLAPSVTRNLIEQFARAARPVPGAVPAAFAELTDRELDVVRLLARGMSNAEIAAELVLGENTIKSHVAHVLQKLGLRDRVQAVVLAYETGLAAPELPPAER